MVTTKDVRIPLLRGSLAIEDSANPPSLWVPEYSSDGHFYPMCGEDGIGCTVSTGCPANVLWHNGTHVDLLSMVASAMKQGRVIFVGEHRSRLSASLCHCLHSGTDRCGHRFGQRLQEDHIWQTNVDIPLASRKRMNSGARWTYKAFCDYACSYYPEIGMVHAAYVWHHSKPWYKEIPASNLEPEDTAGISLQVSGGSG